MTSYGAFNAAITDIPAAEGCCGYKPLPALAIGLLSGNLLITSFILLRSLGRLIRGGEAFFCSGPGVGCGVAGVQRSAIVFYRRLAVLLDIKDPAKIDVAPGQGSGITSGLDSLFKIETCFFHLPR